MEKVGILVVSYGARATAMIDRFKRSQEYDTEIYVADKQRNPFNVKAATKHVIIPDLDIQKICKFASENKNNIDFGIVGPEKPIINGVRDVIEKQTGIPIICPKKNYAIEVSKVAQRELFQEIIPEANPKFKIFDPNEYNHREIKKVVYRWLDELDNNAVVKPDQPAAGKGVGVWGDHFKTREELFEHFLANFQQGSTIIEEKIEGEESSFQAFCDGKHLVPLPETRDYKRAFDNEEGPNTGGMGAYKDVGDVLPFMTTSERDEEENIVRKIFNKMKSSDEKALKGIPFYVAFMHTGDGLKILEINSRPGDPEILNILPILKEDFVDVCYKILEGNLTQVEVEKSATVVIYKVPPEYGGYMKAYPNKVKREEIGTPVNLFEAYKLSRKYKERLFVYPSSMEIRDSKSYALNSRAICAVGIGQNIEAAREISLKGINTISGGALRHRMDIATNQQIQESIIHMDMLRRKKDWK